MYTSKRHNLGLIRAILLLAFPAVVSCSGKTPSQATSPALSPSATITSTPTLQPTLSPTGAIVIRTPQPRVSHLSAGSIEERAQEALANWLGISKEEIKVVEVEEVEWPDTNLGCPQLGMVYAQVITPGYRIVLEVAGQRYECHADTTRRVVGCEPQRAWPVPGGGSTDTVRLAKEDLAGRLGIPVDSIGVVAVLRQEFSADAFYCRTTKERLSREESPATVSGESILLGAVGRKYEYHASGQTVIFCQQLP